MKARQSTLFTFGLLGTLYAAQGLPFGFFSQALPVFLRKQGHSLEAVGLSSLLAAPWAFKFLWAPLVDRHGSARFGRRRGWIIPLQALSTALLFSLAVFPAQGPLLPLLVAVFFTHLFAATQDLASAMRTTTRWLSTCCRPNGVVSRMAFKSLAIASG